MHDGAGTVAPKGRDCFCDTYQSPLPVLRPLAPPSIDVLPAAAEAKLDVNGEGMNVISEVASGVGVEILKCSKLSKLFCLSGLGDGVGRSNCRRFRSD